MYELVALDLDGTTLSSDYKLSKKNIETVHKYSEKGIKFIIITGRTYDSAKPFAKSLSPDMPLTCYNGARIYDKDGKVIFSKELSKNHVDIVKELRVLRENNCTPLFFIDERLTVPWYDDNVKEYETRTLLKAKIDERLLEKEFISTKVIFSSPDYDFLQRLKKDLKDRIGKEVYITSSMSRYIEYLNIEVSKGKAIRWLSEKLGIRLEDIVVMGDNNNDLEMFFPEVYKVAMENASPLLKEKADRITSSNDEDGVARALDKIFGNDEPGGFINDRKY